MIARRLAAWLAVGSLAAAASAAASCAGPMIDVAGSLQVSDVTTGWYDAGVVEGGKNKLVPGIAFRLKNAGATIPGMIQLNTVFRRIGDTEELGSAFIRAVDSNGLAGGAATDLIVLRSELGYTGTEPRAQMLANRLFVDAKVEVFAKYGSAQWVKLGEHPIKRVLLTH